MANVNIPRYGVLDMQICVPKEFTDEQVIEAAECHNASGTSNGWKICKEGSAWLDGCPERVQCEKYPENVHIKLVV